MAPRGSGTKQWTAVDDYFAGLLVANDPQLDAVLEANEKAGLPAIDVSPLAGKLLQLLVQVMRASRILEIGTLGGYSTILMARALGEDGRIVTLEYNPRHAEVARANLENAGVAERVDLRVGAALESLPVLEKENAGAFDLVFIDADKRSNPEYLEWAVKLSRPGSVIVVDNVVRGGRVVNAKSKDADVQGTRRCLEMMGSNPRLNATALQTVGIKGYDGFAIAIVTG